jgi:transcriptional regulator with XRE-family HTH domain
MSAPQYEGIPEKRISSVGRRIHSLRLSRNMSIEDLSRKTSVSSVTISNIEKGVYSPKLSTILEIAQALDTTIMFLVEDVEEPQIFKIEKDKQRFVSKKGVTLHDFGHVIVDRRVSVYIMEMKDGAVTEEHDSFDGNEFIHLLSGEIVVEIEDRTERLAEGDSLYFHGSYRHMIKAEKASKLFFISVHT